MYAKKFSHCLKKRTKKHKKIDESKNLIGI